MKGIVQMTGLELQKLLSEMPLEDLQKSFVVRCCEGGFNDVKSIVKLNLIRDVHDEDETYYGSHDTCDECEYGTEHHECEAITHFELSPCRANSSRSD